VTTCSCTKSDFYWSSTSVAGTPHGAWAATFYYGIHGSVDKLNNLYARAVRGGS